MKKDGSPNIQNAKKIDARRKIGPQEMNKLVNIETNRSKSKYDSLQKRLY